MLLIFLLSVASTRRKLKKNPQTEDYWVHTNSESCNLQLRYSNLLSSIIFLRICINLIFQNVFYLFHIHYTLKGVYFATVFNASGVSCGDRLNQYLATKKSSLKYIINESSKKYYEIPTIFQCVEKWSMLICLSMYESNVAIFWICLDATFLDTNDYIISLFVLLVFLSHNICIWSKRFLELLRLLLWFTLHSEPVKSRLIWV